MILCSVDERDKTLRFAFLPDPYQKVHENPFQDVLELVLEYDGPEDSFGIHQIRNESLTFQMESGPLTQSSSLHPLLRHHPLSASRDSRVSSQSLTEPHVLPPFCKVPGELYVFFLSQADHANLDASPWV